MRVTDYFDKNEFSNYVIPKLLPCNDIFFLKQL